MAAQPVQPDERVRGEVRGRLGALGAFDVTVENGEVTLEGIVENRFAKRQAEDAAWEVEGVRDVHNRIRIQQERAGGPTLTTREPGANLGGTTQRS